MKKVREKILDKIETFKRTAVACVFALVVLPFGQAHSAVQAPDWDAASAQVDITGLSYQLIDLAPDDGIAPQVTFLPFVPVSLAGGQAAGFYSPISSSHQINLTSPLELATQLLPSEEFEGYAPDGSSFFKSTNTSFHIGAGFNEADIPANFHTVDALDKRVLGTFAAGGGGGSISNLSVVGVQVEDPETGDLQTIGYAPEGSFQLGPDSETQSSKPYFSLTPMTKIVFSMQVNLRASVDLAFVQAYQDQAGFDLSTVVAAGLGTARLVDVSNLPPLWETEEEGMAYMRADRAFAGFGIYSQFGPTTGVESQLLSVSLSNDTLDAMKGVVSFGGSTSVNMTAAIPEPSTTALLGMGLLAVAGTVRRRHARSVMTRQV